MPLSKNRLTLLSTGLYPGRGDFIPTLTEKTSSVKTFSPFFQNEEDLQDMMTRVFQEGLEGLVLKDVKVLN